MLNTKFVMSGVNILPSISLIAASFTAETGLKRFIFSTKTGKTCFLLPHLKWNFKDVVTCYFTS